jgi:threonine dehydratase
MLDGIPELSDVLDARRLIAAHLDRTPLGRYPLLDRLVGAEVFVKHENHLPTGAFKVRGGINLVARLAGDGCAAGVCAASTGNHGQSVAFAARLFDVEATIFVPRGANPVKVSAMRALGAEVVEHGVDFDEARERCADVSVARGARYVHSADEPLLIAGVATATLEILEREPAIDVILVPVGGGSGAAGACVAAKAVRPGIEVIAVQSKEAPAAYRAWREHTLAQDVMTTFAEGLQTRVAFALPQRILARQLNDFVLVTDDDLRAATLNMIELTRNLVEPAGAAPSPPRSSLASVLPARRSLSSAPAATSAQRNSKNCSTGAINRKTRQQTPAPRTRCSRHEQVQSSAPAWSTVRLTFHCGRSVNVASRQTGGLGESAGAAELEGEEDDPFDASGSTLLYQGSNATSASRTTGPTRRVDRHAGRRSRGAAPAFSCRRRPHAARPAAPRISLTLPLRCRQPSAGPQPRRQCRSGPSVMARSLARMPALSRRRRGSAHGQLSTGPK